MQLARILLSYALVVGVLFSTLAGGVLLLLQPGPAVSQEARPAPIPQRIADSIERKKPFPVQEPTITEPKLEALKPAMHEANASLAWAPIYSTRNRELRAPVTQPRRQRSGTPAAREAPAVSASRLATALATRSDFPY